MPSRRVSVTLFDVLAKHYHEGLRLWSSEGGTSLWLSCSVSPSNPPDQNFDNKKKYVNVVLSTVPGIDLSYIFFS